MANSNTFTGRTSLWLEDEELPEIEVNRFGARVEDDGGLAELTGELSWSGNKKKH